jgi:hypothetical protein
MLVVSPIEETAKLGCENNRRKAFRVSAKYNAFPIFKVEAHRL